MASIFEYLTIISWRTLGLLSAHYVQFIRNDNFGLVKYNVYKAVILSWFDMDGKWRKKKDFFFFAIWLLRLRLRYDFLNIISMYPSSMRYEYILN